MVLQSGFKISELLEHTSLYDAFTVGDRIRRLRFWQIVFPDVSRSALG